MAATDRPGSRKRFSKRSSRAPQGQLFGSSSTSDKDKADQLATQNGLSGCLGATPPSSCGEQADLRDSQGNKATLSTVFLVSGGVLAAAGAGVFLFWPHQKNVQVAPTASAHHAGLLVTGHF